MSNTNEPSVTSAHAESAASYPTKTKYFPSTQEGGIALADAIADLIERAKYAGLALIQELDPLMRELHEIYSLCGQTNPRLQYLSEHMERAIALSAPLRTRFNAPLAIGIPPEAIPMPEMSKTEEGGPDFSAVLESESPVQGKERPAYQIEDPRQPARQSRSG